VIFPLAAFYEPAVIMRDSRKAGAFAPSGAAYLGLLGYRSGHIASLTRCALREVERREA